MLTLPWSVTLLVLLPLQAVSFVLVKIPMPALNVVKMFPEVVMPSIVTLETPARETPFPPLFVAVISVRVLPVAQFSAYPVPPPLDTVVPSIAKLSAVGLW